MALDEVDKLIERFLDDRESLGESQLAALLEALDQTPELASELKSQLMVDELLAQRLTVDRQNFMAQVEQRVADHLQGEGALDAQVAELRTLATYQYDEWMKENKAAGSRKLWWGTAAVAALLLIAAGAAVGYVATQNWGQLAVIAELRGSVAFIRDGQTEPAATLDGVKRGDRLRTLGDGFARVRYSDGTLVEIAPGSLVEFESDRSTGGKRVFIERGGLSADITKQPARRPMVFGSLSAEATVRGTRLMLDVEGESVRLDVIEGAVDVVRPLDQAKVTVGPRQFVVASPDALKVKPIAWPTNDAGLAFQFQTGDEPNDLQPRGQARLDHDFALELAGGAFVAPRESAMALLSACQKTNQLTIEAVVCADDLRQSGPARIVAFSTDSFDYNFMLGQENDWLVLRLATTREEAKKVDRRQVKLCRLEDTAPHHIVFSYRDGQAVCYRDGMEVEILGGPSMKGDFRDWGQQHLLLGDEWDGDRDWSGQLEGVAIYNRTMPAIEARRNAEFYLAQIAAREPVPQIEVRAQLIERSTAPTYADIAPARSLLVMSKYRVEQVLQGKLTDDEVLVMQWAILDATRQPINDVKPGGEFTLLLEHAQHNPQLGRTRCANDFDGAQDRSRAVYYEVRRATKKGK